MNMIKRTKEGKEDINKWRWRIDLFIIVLFIQDK
jgi:hypothetical protein